jgi:hypothetical protein
MKPMHLQDMRSERESGFCQLVENSRWSTMQRDIESDLRTFKSGSPTRSLQMIPFPPPAPKANARLASIPWFSRVSTSTQALAGL